MSSMHSQACVRPLSGRHESQWSQSMQIWVSKSVVLAVDTTVLHEPSPILFFPCLHPYNPLTIFYTFISHQTGLSWCWFCFAYCSLHPRATLQSFYVLCLKGSVPFLSNTTISDSMSHFLNPNSREGPSDYSYIFEWLVMSQVLINPRSSVHEHQI